MKRSSRSASAPSIAQNASDSQRPAVVKVCPLCHGHVERVRRRWIDRLINIFSPGLRYRCVAKGWGCDWEGNLRD